MQIMASLIPLAIGCVAAARGLWWLHAAAMATILVLAGILPAAKRIESVYVFVLTAISMIPLNVCLVRHTMDIATTDATHPVLRLCWAVVFFGILVNLEEILLLRFAQFLWPRQQHIFRKKSRTRKGELDEQNDHSERLSHRGNQKTPCYRRRRVRPFRPRPDPHNVRKKERR